MGENTEQISIQIAAQIREFLSGMGQASDAVKNSTAEMQNHFNQLGSVVKTVSGIFIGLTAILGGGKLFKEAIDETVKWNSEVGKLARTLGTTTESASVLKVALHTLGIEQDTYTRAAMMMTRQIDAGGKGFAALGISARDVHGNLKPTTRLLQESIDKLAGLKAGTDRNAAGLLVFGRAWGEVQTLVRLTSERMAEAKREAEELHLIVGPEGVAKTREYQESLRRIGLIWDAMKIQIGNAVMPALTTMGKWFGEKGPLLVDVTRMAIEYLLAALVGLVTAFETAGKGLATLYETFVLGVTRMSTALTQGVMKGKFREAAEYMRNTGTEIGDLWNRKGIEAAAAWELAGKRIKEILSGGGKATPGAGEPNAGGTGFAGPPDKNQGKHVIYDLERMEHERRELWKAIEADHEFRLADYRRQEAEAADDSEKKIALQQAVVAEEIKMHGEQSREAQAAETRLVEIKREGAARARQLQLQAVDIARDYQAALLDLDEQAIKNRYELGEINARQEITQLRALENEKYAILVKAAKDKAALEIDPEKRAAQLAQIQQLELQHAGKIAALNQQMAMTVKQRWDSVFSAMSSAFSSAISGMINGTQSFSQALRSIFGSLLDFYVRTVTEMFLTWIKGKLLERQVTVQNAQITGTANAIAAGTGAAASAASTPGYGWTIAIPVGLAVLAATMAMLGGMKSAAGGFDIPRTMNPVTQLHAGEMVLPRALADRVRSITEDHQPISFTFAPRVQALDRRGVEDVLKSQAATFLKQMAEWARNGRQG